MESIIEYTNVLSESLCDDIVDMFNEQTTDKFTNVYEIPKYSKEWSKIEGVLYKQMLVYLNKYNMAILPDNSELYSNLSSDLKITHFKIQKYDNTLKEFVREPNRKNLITAVLFLNQPTTGGELVFSNNLSDKKITPVTGNLVLFPDEIEYIYNISPCDEEYYVITAQISVV
jgi:predicted 2-oxoglutarate/Fe(II)-dependent dioxygenase YbiX